MFRPTKRPIGSKTDLQLPGQKIVVNGRTESIQSLFNWADPNAATQTRLNDNRDQPPVLRKKPVSDTDTDGRKPVYIDPRLQTKIVEQQSSGVFQRARQLIVRIGRPRQP